MTTPTEDKRIHINLDSTALGSSACILNLSRVVIGDLKTPELGGYTDKIMNIELVYGIAVHKFIDTMFKTGGHYPTARKEAELMLQLPNRPNNKKLWMNDPKHLMTTCYMVWTDYVEQDATFELLSVKQDCFWCKGTGTIVSTKSIVTSDETVRLVAENPCIKCSGTGTIEGPATELTFSLPYYEDDHIVVRLCGTIDSVGKFKGGCYAIRDWKTTGSWSNEGYFEQYELSRQLRLYTLACKLMYERFPNSTLGQIGGTHMGAFIDGVFLKQNANETKCERSSVYTFKQDHIDAFRRTLDRKIQDISTAVKENYFPKEGILNGTCEQKFSKCRFWHTCKSDDQVSGVLLNRDFKRKIYDPLKFNT